MKKIILAALVAGSIAGTTFAAGGNYAGSGDLSSQAGTGDGVKIKAATTVFSGIFANARNDKEMAAQTVTFTVTQTHKQAGQTAASADMRSSIVSFLTTMGAEKVTYNAATTLFETKVKGVAKSIWCVQASMGPGTSPAQIVCSIKENLAQKAAAKLAACSQSTSS